MNTTTEQAVPSNIHGTCAWCRRHFETVAELIDHVHGPRRPGVRPAA